MMNTLANHAFLPHDGRNLTEDVVVNALNSALNFDKALGAVMFEQALIANPEPNATYFTLYEIAHLLCFSLHLTDSLIGQIREALFPKRLYLSFPVSKFFETFQC